MAQLFQQLSDLKPFEIKEKSEESLDWFRVELRNVRRRPDRILRSGEVTTKTYVGKMYMFFYDAKYKETLPYWDRFPLMIMMDHYTDGFLGMNLHYIAPRYRVILLNNLYDLLINEDMDGMQRLMISYDLLSKKSGYRWMKPCIKRYLKSNLESRLFEVPIEHWDMVSMLPSARFNVNANTVYAESRKRF